MSLPVVSPDRHKPYRASRWRTLLGHAGRCLLVLLIAIGLRVAAEKRAALRDSDRVRVEPMTATSLGDLFPAIASVGDPSTDAMQQVFGTDGQEIGFIIQTAPIANDVVGYRGPSNCVLWLDQESKVKSARLLDSGDTPEHVEAVIADQNFFKQFNGWTLGDATTITHVDGTSGATLTSLAIAEGIAVRLGSDKPSLRFPDAIDQNDLRGAFDDPERLQLKTIDGFRADVLSREGQPIGQLVRTGPLVESIAGYQGPSELLIRLDNNQTIDRVTLRKTYDNEPYDDYVREEAYFWNHFVGKSIQQVAALDVEAEGIEGVSGATMTSLAVADTMVAAAKAYLQKEASAKQAQRKRRIHWSAKETGTVLVLLGAIVIGTTRLRGIKWLRVSWQIVLIVYFGLITGNLVSQAIVMGWSAQGIGWRLAPGLFLVIAFSFLLPITSKRNLYCSHVCPHGAAQQLLRRRSPWQWTPGKRVGKWLARIPGTLLVAAVLVTAFGLDWNLAAWEPFNAYIWYVAGATSLVLAIGSLIFASTTPMAYCRYGCPTGSLLEYLRRHAKSGRLAGHDIAALLLATVVWAWALLGNG